MLLKVSELLKDVSIVKMLVLMLFTLVFVDMLAYYVAAFFGKEVMPYPILYEVFSLLKEIHIEPNR